MTSGTFSKSYKGIMIGLAAVIYVITAWNSHGFYHADEHYQVIEFAGYKLGTHAPEELAWEFKAQSRQAIQPAIAYLVFKSLEVFQIDNPYHQAFVLRFLSVALALWAITFFVKHTKKSIPHGALRKVYSILSYFLWFIPFISTRFSSETWSGLLFLIALTFFMKDSVSKRNAMTIGFFFGLSFLFRFQIAFAILGFGLWLIFINRTTWAYVFRIFIAFCAALLIGVMIDSWFYETFVFTPWNYFYKQLIEGVVDSFGTSPWYSYVDHLWHYPGFFIGASIILSLLILLFSKPKHYVLWILIPFIAGHSLIGHKEVRFLFPLVYLCPLLLMLGYQSVISLVKNNIVQRIINYSLVSVFLIINSLGVMAMGQKSAGIGRMTITKYIHDKYGEGPINVIFCLWANPYNPWHAVPIKFYLEDGYDELKISNLCELNDTLLKEDAVNLVVIRKRDKQNKTCAQFLNNERLVFETQSIPKWIENLNEIYNGIDNQNILELYRYQ